MSRIGDRQKSRTITHARVWRALDALAADHGLSTARLAVTAGQHKTSFAPSKRVTAHGPRWPTVETIAACLAVTGESFADFGRRIENGGRP